MSSTEPRGRNRDATQSALLDAARALVATEGFQGLGVNAVARAAKCDKQLIYRYFGGLDGLIDAMGAHLAETITAALDAAAPTVPAATYRDLIQQLAVAYLRVLRADTFLQKQIAWELSSPAEAVQRLNAARGVGMMRWMTARRGDLTPSPGVDAPALNAMMIGAVQQMVLSATATGAFMGMPLRTDADWQRVETALTALIDASY